MRDVLVVDVAILAAVTLYSVVSLSHIAQTWLMRTDLQVFMRSPGLATLSGLSGTLMFLFTVSRFMLGIMTEAGPFDLLFLPMLLTLYTGAYIMRGLRLLVMYNPHLRKRWGWCVKETASMRALVASWVVLEVIIWAATILFGVRRVADLTALLFTLDTGLTIGASFLFCGMLRKTDDIYKVSAEIKKLGAFALLALCSSAGYIAVQSPYLMLLWMMVRFQSALWITNIQPIRVILRRRAGHEKEDGGGAIASLFPYLPWKTQRSRKVAVVEYVLRPRPQNTTCTDAGDVLDMILHVPPLLQAFEDYCRKALCSESLMFLLAAESFKTFLEEAPTAKTTGGYARYIALVDKHIRERSPYEVNIESKIRREILRTTDKEIFEALTVEEKSKVLEPAVKEVGKMLKDNLYDKFCVIQEYKQIQDQLYS